MSINNENINKDNDLHAHFIDESYRMDDNSNYSSIALEESENIDDPLIPGIGIEETGN